jgi:hypothetical protein
MAVVIAGAGNDRQSRHVSSLSRELRPDEAASPDLPAPGCPQGPWLSRLSSPPMADSLSRMSRSRATPGAIPRHFLLILGVILLAVLIGGGAFVYLRDLGGGARDSERTGFITTCKQQGRIANGGGALAMDDATEAALDRYCGCVADRLERALDPVEMGKIGDGSATPDSLAKLDRVVAACRVQALKPAQDDQPTDN